MKYQPKTKPLYPKQGAAVVRAVRHRNYGIFAEPRTGKSWIALNVAAVHALREGGIKVLIIGPRISLDIWEQEIEKHWPYRALVEDFDHEPWGVNYDDPKRNSTLRHNFFFLAGREETFRAVRKGKKLVRPKQKILEAWDPDFIIVDESHEYKRPGGRAAQDAWRMIRRLRARHPQSGKPYVLLLTGTPAPKGYIDLFSQFRIMDEEIFGTNVLSFKDRHVVYGHGKQQWTIIKYRKEKILERKVRDHSVTITEEEAGLAREMMWQSLKVVLPDHAKRLYLEMVEEFLAELEGGKILEAKNAGVKRIRLLQITGGFTTDGTQIHTARLEKLKAYLALLQEQEESAVVYARFIPEVLACYEVAHDLGFRAFVVYGDTPRPDRARAIRSLSTRPSHPTCVVFQPQAGSRSIDLSGAAEAIYYSSPDGWIDYRQTLGRIRGPHQTRAVRYTHLVAPGTVDVGTIRGLKQKESWHDSLMQNPRGYLLGL